eukprot:2855277-Pleurochrysis_carterae.AAC.1
MKTLTFVVEVDQQLNGTAIDLAFALPSTIAALVRRAPSMITALVRQACRRRAWSRPPRRPLVH